MLKKILSLVSNSNSFIEIYDDLLSAKECDIIISYFEKSPQKRGKLGIGKVMPEFKACSELSETHFKEGDVISNILKPQLIKGLDRYHEKYKSLRELQYWGLDDYYNVQKYDGEEDGYFVWHEERGDDIPFLNRVLVWMFYLNDAKSGTEFMHFPTVNPKKGRLVIWPPGWEYTHRGVTPNKGLKYIATGWCSYVTDGDDSK
jgi:hypothetical protein